MKILCSFLLAVFFYASFSVYADEQRMNFDFDSISTKSALQLIADFSQLNLIGADDVDGTITMRMKSVTWEDALKYIVKTKGLHSQIEGNVLYVSKDKDYFIPLDSPLPKADDNKNTIFNIKHMLASEAIAGFPLFSKEFNQESLAANDASGVVVARLSPPGSKSWPHIYVRLIFRDLK